MGSSPLTRGKQCKTQHMPRSPGLIPAHAGKTVTRFCPRCHARAHPRSRGENLMNPWMMFLPAGSSPLTRGKHHEEAVDAYQDGLIPAHAGKTRPLAPAQSPSGAHPRSRGENGKADDNLRLAAGSSPLTRGKRNDNPRDPLSTGLIPAHAGKTAARPRSGSPRRAHPRSRGENSSARSCAKPKRGSSPLTRGKR